MNKIIVIDDDYSVHEFFKENLKLTTVITFNNIQDFFKKKFDFSLKVIFLDIKIKQHNGLDYVKKIKLIYPYVPIIIISSYPSKNYLIQSIQLPVENFIEKPLLAAKFKSIIDDQVNKMNSYNSGIQILKTLVNSNEMIDFTIREFVKKNHYDYKYFCYLFKKNTKVSIRAYINENKYKKACSYLVGTNLSIKKISYQLGFSNPSAFMKGFKKKFKKTPTEYRKG